MTTDEFASTTELNSSTRPVPTAYPGWQTLWHTKTNADGSREHDFHASGEITHKHYNRFDIRIVEPAPGSAQPITFRYEGSHDTPASSGIDDRHAKLFRHTSGRITFKDKSVGDQLANNSMVYLAAIAARVDCEVFGTCPPSNELGIEVHTEGYHYGHEDWLHEEIEGVFQANAARAEREEAERKADSDNTTAEQPSV